MIRSEPAGERIAPGRPIAPAGPARETPLDAPRPLPARERESVVVPRPSRPGQRVRFEIRSKAGGRRVVSHLEPRLAAAYASVVAPVVPAVEAGLGPRVLAERAIAARRAPAAVVLRAWPAARRSLLEAAARRAGPLVHTDVAQCYASISPDAVVDRLGVFGVASRDVEACRRLLLELADEGVRGLPIGPAASAVLANAVLSAGDDALERRGSAFLRWVDDWWIALPSPEEAAGALHVLGGALAPFGLRLHAGKTGLVDGVELGGASGTSEYHRATHAHALPFVDRANAVVPLDGRMGAGGRPPRRASGQR
jgi:Reverse transcriptase (RNA-dependent DNA polymerase)